MEYARLTRLLVRLQPYSKSKLELKSNLRARFYQLIARLSAILPQLNLTKVKLECLKFGFKCKKERYNTDENFLHHSSSTFFKFSSSLLLKYGR